MKIYVNLKCTSFFFLNNTMSLYLWVQNIAYIQILLNYYYYWSKSPANLNIDTVHFNSCWIQLRFWRPHGGDFYPETQERHKKKPDWLKKNKPIFRPARSGSSVSRLTEWMRDNDGSEINTICSWKNKYILWNINFFIRQAQGQQRRLWWPWRLVTALHTKWYHGRHLD